MDSRELHLALERSEVRHYSLAAIRAAIRGGNSDCKTGTEEVDYFAGLAAQNMARLKTQLGRPEFLQLRHQYFREVGQHGVSQNFPGLQIQILVTECVLNPI